MDESSDTMMSVDSPATDPAICRSPKEYPKDMHQWSLKELNNYCATNQLEWRKDARIKRARRLIKNRIAASNRRKKNRQLAEKQVTELKLLRKQLATMRKQDEERRKEEKNARNTYLAALADFKFVLNDLVYRVTQIEDRSTTHSSDGCSWSDADLLEMAKEVHDNKPPTPTYPPVDLSEK